MHIPEKFSMRSVTHGSGSAGFALYVDEDVSGLGIRRTMKRLARANDWQETWTLDALPGKTFFGIRALIDAAKALTDEDVAAERAKWPQIRGVHPDPCHNPCRLCRREAPRLAGPNAPQTYRLEIYESWQRMHSLSVCATHLAEFGGKPAELLAAMWAEVAERKARAAARPAFPALR